MCLAVCNRKLGGCGYIGDDREWKEDVTARLCPVCGYDMMYFVHHYNLESVVDASMIEKARKRLDENHASLRGRSLRTADRNASVPSRRLHPEKNALVEEIVFS